MTIDMFIDPAADPRGDAPLRGQERETLVGFLRWQRATLELKCSGLDAEAMARRAVEPSSMSLLGLLRHLAVVERDWFRVILAGERPAPLDPDGDFDGAVADPEVVATAWRNWRAETARSDAFIEAAPDLDLTGEERWRGPISLRWILVHLIEEYARHNGHADLLRERVDGRVGQ